MYSMFTICCGDEKINFALFSRTEVEKLIASPLFNPTSGISLLFLSKKEKYSSRNSFVNGKFIFNRVTWKRKHKCTPANIKLQKNIPKEKEKISLKKYNIQIKTKSTDFTMAGIIRKTNLGIHKQ